ncbi:CDC48 family AAA ATPase [Acetomicrobium sp.]|uniref:CDC48 family AAA ATPase n=1 Tax=Acetomicrobium sp. TaxID=1872099 RepID=UPI00235B62DE|nr:CDC48 family AAA ATPase [Acetomicrobium sp.]
MEQSTIVLRVAEAKTKDVGRGIIRIDPQNMARIGLDVGDVVEIEGKRKTVARAMPTYPQDRGNNIVQMDGIIRNNAGVSLTEKVTLKKVEFRIAEHIFLVPLTSRGGLLSPNDAKYIGTLLGGQALMEGDVVRVNLFGTRSADFLVDSTSPKGVVMIGSGTRILFRDKEAKASARPKISYEDIGGLDKELQRVRELIEFPLKYPQVFERLGIDPPKGVLLYGPPGCGKTLIARAVANEAAVNFIHITGPDIMGKYYGESEQRLRSVFEDAKKNAPSILFIDEIDAIAPKREEMGGEKQVERRVVAQLLALMDGLESRGDVLVIGATNIPNSIDPALRRPGRFDREIEIGIPDQLGRLDILLIHTRGMPLAQDVDLERLSKITHGFVGADLEALCREAAMKSMRRIMADVQSRNLSNISYEMLSEIEVTMDDFMGAFAEAEPSAIREVFVEIPDVTWADVGGLEGFKDELIEAITWPLKYRDLFDKLRLKPPKGILLSGPPGVGKTLMAKALAHESGVNFISLKGSELMSKFVGESEKSVREVFRKARQANPCILFFDEFDSLVPSRKFYGDSSVTERVISQFLTELDGIEELKGVLVLAATNREDLIDPAILRPGRFDFILRIPLPDENDRLCIFKIHCTGKPLSKDVDLNDLARKTDGFCGADIEFICQEASRIALREHISRAGMDDLTVTGRHFNEALEKLRKQKFGEGYHVS